MAQNDFRSVFAGFPRDATDREFTPAQTNVQLLEQLRTAALPIAEPPSSTCPSDLADSARATFCFGKGQLNTDFLGVIQQISGLAVHDARLRKIKSNHSTAWRKYLEAFFKRAEPTGGLGPREAARLAHAVLVGLGTNALFDRGLRGQAAHALFRSALRGLAGLEWRTE